MPTIVKLLVEHPAVDRHDHSSLRCVIYAGAPLYRADQKLALQKLGRVLAQYFGLGEVTGCITVLPPDRHSAYDDDDPQASIGSCGRPRTGMEVAVLDAPLKALPAGEVGVAVVVVRDAAGVDKAGLLAHLDGRCARYRWRQQVLFRDALPKSGQGKPSKRDIRDRWPELP